MPFAHQRAESVLFLSTTCADCALKVLNHEPSCEIMEPERHHDADTELCDRRPAVIALNVTATSEVDEGRSVNYQSSPITDTGTGRSLPFSVSTRASSSKALQTTAKPVTDDFALKPVNGNNFSNAIVMRAPCPDKGIELSGEEYVGPLVDGKAEGHGKINFSNGDIYDGWFVRGHIQGEGVYNKASPPAYVYKGSFFNDRKHGQGLLEWGDGSWYEGCWIDGFMHGRGKLSLSTGSGYEGEFEYDEFSGMGTINYKDGGQYTGQWVKGRPSGTGRHVAADGTMYEGSFLEGLWHGKGTVTKATGERHSTNWFCGKEQGSKVLLREDNTAIKGQWHNGTVTTLQISNR